MRVYLDDLREAPAGWIRACSYQEAIEILKTGKVEEISLDHDLGSSKDKDGYDVVKWIEEMVFKTKFRPPYIWVHSANPVGVHNIEVAATIIRQIAKRKGTYRGRERPSGGTDAKSR